MFPRFAKHERWTLSLLVLLPFVWWHPLLLGSLPDFMDTVTLQYPLRLAAARQVWQGTLPLWAPEIMCGVPLAANPEVAVWYPLHIPFFLLPGPRSYGLALILHYILGGLGGYFLCRKLQCPPLAALFGGLTFQFGSFMVSHIALPPRVFAMPWILWTLLAVETDCRNPTSKRWVNRATILAAVFLALHLLAGALQFAYYSAMGIALYWIVRFVSIQGGKRLPVLFVKGALVLLLAGALSAVQLIPTLEYIAASERSAGLGLEKIREQALNGGFLWRALVGFTGKRIEDTDTLHAIGVGALAILPFAFFRRRTRRVAVALLAVGALGYLLALGAWTPFWGRILPYYSSLHAPRRALVLWSLAGPIIAALGLRNVLAWFRCLEQPKSPGRFSGALPIALLVVLVLPNVLMLPRLERKFASPARFYPDPEALALLRDGRFFTLDPSLNYAHGSRSEGYGDSMLPNLSAWHGARDIQGYCSLVLRRYGEARSMASRRSGIFYPAHSALFTNPASPILRLLHVRHLIGRYDLFNPSIVIPGAGLDVAAVAERVEPVLESERWPIWRYREESPFAWLPEGCLTEDTSERALLMAASQPDPYRLAFADLQDPPDPDPLLARAQGPLKISRVEPLDARRWRIEFSNPVEERDGRLAVVSVSWMKGWKARASGTGRLPTFPVNGVNTAVVVPQGASWVELVYNPRSFWLGLSATIVCLTLVGGLWVRLGRGLEREGNRRPPGRKSLSLAPNQEKGLLPPRGGR